MIFLKLTSCLSVVDRSRSGKIFSKLISRAYLIFERRFDIRSVFQDLKESEEKCKKWERDYDFAVEQINKRNKEIGDLQEVTMFSWINHANS